jgi:hypothetical protein
MTVRISSVVGALMLIAAVLLLVLLGWQFLAVETCISVGGSYHYPARTCDMTSKHSFPGFWRAVGLPLVGAAIAAASGIRVMVTGSRDAER